MPSSMSSLNSEMPSTPNKLTTTKSTMPKEPNVTQNSNSEDNKSLMPPMSSETQPTNSTAATPKKSEPKTNSNRTNNKPSPTTNTWESFLPKEMLNNHTSTRETNNTLMPSKPSMKPKTSSPVSSVDQPHSLKSARSHKRCSTTPSKLRPSPTMPQPSLPSLNSLPKKDNSTNQPSKELLNSSKP